MNTAGRCIAILTLLLAAAAGVAAQSRVTVSIGHSGAVRAVAGHPDLEVAFTTGDDGSLKVWDLARGGLRTSLQVSHFPISRIAVHPVSSRSEIVLFIQETRSTGRLLGLDWKTGDELFSVRVDSNPNYLAYSPQGTWVVYTVRGFDSVYLIDSDTASRRAFLDQGFGSVSFVQMATSERNIMTYVPSRGEFIYWQLETGNELQTVSTIARMEHLTLVDESTNRFLAAASDNELVVVDNLTGEVRATYPVSPILGISHDAGSGRILVLTEQAGRRTTLAFTYNSGRLRRTFYSLQNLSREVTALSAVGTTDTRGFLTGDEAGEIAFFDDRNGRRALLGPANPTAIVDVGFTPGRLHLAIGSDGTATELLSLVSDLFEESSRPSATFLSDSRTVVPGMEQLRLTPDGNRLLIWGSDEPGTVSELLPPSAQPEPVYEGDLGVPIARLRASETGPLVVHRDGTVVQVAGPAEVERFRYAAVGTQDAMWDPQLGLIVAKTRTSAFDSSLIVVDPLTQETIGANTDAFLTTRLAMDPGTRTLYAIGLHGNQSAPQTRLIELTGRGFSDARVMNENPDELSRGDLVWDARTDSLLSSMDYHTVLRYRGRSVETLEEVERLHNDLAIGANLIAARNLDGTVTLWKRVTGEHLADVYVIGAEWIAITLEGDYLTSSRTAERYLTFLPAERTRLEREDFRITFPLEP